MKRSELKALIKECVREALFEEGILSGIVAEVASGIMKSQQIVTETKSPQASQALQAKISEEQTEEKRKKLLETKRKMLDAIGSTKMANVFEGTEPLSSAGSVSSGPQVQGPLSGVDPSDAGIDITGLMNLAGRKWQQLK
jgi:hypothetical protein